jgi:hypothetical protein
MHSRRIRDKFRPGNGYTPTLKRRFARPGKETENPMGIIEGVLKTGVTLAVLFVVIGAVAALFMIVFGIATGIDEKIQE